MNYNLRTLCANFSRGNSASRIVPGSVWGLFHCLPSPHTKSQQSETITFLTVLLQPVFSCCGEWEPGGPCWQVWIIPVIFSLKHYSNKEDTYYHSRAVSTQSDPLTHYSMNVASKLHTFTQTHIFAQPMRVGRTHECTCTHKRAWSTLTQNKHHHYKAIPTTASLSQLTTGGWCIYLPPLEWISHGETLQQA